MKNVEFSDVKEFFNPIWSGNTEMFWYEIAWDILSKANLTQYEEKDLKHRCEIYVYPYVLQMLMGEFSYFMFNESYNYECEHDFDDDILNAAAVGWLYRDSLDGYANINECFSNEASNMLMNLVRQYRYVIADILFELLGDLILYLLYFSAVTPFDEAGNEIAFENKESYYNYAKQYCESEYEQISIFDSFEQECQVMHWIISHSCAFDD